MTLVTQWTADQLYEFYKECQRRGLKTVAEREALVEEFVKEKKCTTAYVTERSKEQIITDMAKHQTVLHIKPNEKGADDAGREAA